MVTLTANLNDAVFILEYEFWNKYWNTRGFQYKMVRCTSSHSGHDCREQNVNATPQRPRGRLVDIYMGKWSDSEVGGDGGFITDFSRPLAGRSAVWWPYGSLDANLGEYQRNDDRDDERVIGTHPTPSSRPNTLSHGRRVGGVGDPMGLSAPHSRKYVWDDFEKYS